MVIQRSVEMPQENDDFILLWYGFLQGCRIKIYRGKDKASVSNVGYMFLDDSWETIWFQIRSTKEEILTRIHLSLREREREKHKRKKIIIFFERIHTYFYIMVTFLCQIYEERSGQEFISVLREKQRENEEQTKPYFKRTHIYFYRVVTYFCHILYQRRNRTEEIQVK